MLLEGHVPASEIKRLLNERPKAVGLAVSGMPVGSPGMEAAHSEAFSVLFSMRAAIPQFTHDIRRSSRLTLKPMGD